MIAGRGMLLAAAAAGLLTNRERPTGGAVLTIEPAAPEPPARTPASVIVCQHGARRGIWCQDGASYTATLQHPSIRRATRGECYGDVSYYGLPVRIATAAEWAELERGAAEGKPSPDPMADVRAWTAFWEDLGRRQREAAAKAEAAAEHAAKLERTRPQMERADAKRARKAAKRLACRGPVLAPDSPGLTDGQGGEL